jgi:hypothetical protein
MRFVRGKLVCELGAGNRERGTRMTDQFLDLIRPISVRPITAIGLLGLAIMRGIVLLYSTTS